MKKGIKYAGIAAATLLAVSPVVAPVVGSTTQTVQAADTNVSTVDTANIAKFFKQFSDQSMTQDEIEGLLTFTGYAEDVDYSTFVSQGDMDFYSLRDYTANADLKLDDTSVNVVAVDAKGNALTADDFATVVDSKPASISLKYTVKYNDKNDKQQSLSKTIKITTTKEQENNTDQKTNAVTQLNGKFTTPLNVEEKSDTLNVKLTPSIDLALVNQDGKDIKFSSPVLSGLYKSYTAAKTASTDEKDKFTAKTFDEKGKTYYQAITVNIAAGALGQDKDGKNVVASDIINGYANGKDGYSVTINGKKALASQYAVTDAAKDKTNTITFVRAINVVDQGATWTTSAVKGKVVIAKDKIAKLYTTKNELATRSLAGYSGWLTTTKRTNAAGVTQYQVSTDEWINAEDATFVAADSTETNANETDNAAGLTNIQKLTGYHKVTLAGPASFLYSLFDKDMNRSNRVIAGDSAWFTDQTAQDSKGVTYYRISTNEWIPAGNGLTFK